MAVKYPSADIPLPENEPRGSNSSKPSTSPLLSGAGGKAGAECEASVVSWLGLTLAGGEDALGTAERSPSLLKIRSYDHFRIVEAETRWLIKVCYLSLRVGLRAVPAISS